MLLLTDVHAVVAHFGTPRAEPLHHLDLDQIERMTFPAGSMGPKIDACRRFVTATGRPAAIGSLDEATTVLAGTSGTTVTLRPQQNPPARPFSAAARGQRGDRCHRDRWRRGRR